MSYKVNIVPKQTKGVPFQSISGGTLTVENPYDDTGILPKDYPLLFSGETYYFEITDVFNAESGFVYTADISFYLQDGTLCQRQFVAFDEVNISAGFTTGFSIGFFT